MYEHADVPIARRVITRWGHYAPEMLMASVGAVIAMNLVPPNGALLLAAPIGLLLFVIATWMLMRAHDRRLCEHCVASMPLNPSELATRYRRRFWLTHNGASAKYALPYLGVLIASNAIPGSAGRLVWALAQSTLIYLLASYTTHRRLQPWCPWCKGGGGGHDDEPATPEPVEPERRRQPI